MTTAVLRGKRGIVFQKAAVQLALMQAHDRRKQRLIYVMWRPREEDAAQTEDSYIDMRIGASRGAMLIFIGFGKGFREAP